MKSVSLCDDSDALVPRMENWCNQLPKNFVYIVGIWGIMSVC